MGSGQLRDDAHDRGPRVRRTCGAIARDDFGAYVERLRFFLIHQIKVTGRARIVGQDHAADRFVVVAALGHEIRRFPRRFGHDPWRRRSQRLHRLANLAGDADRHDGVGPGLGMGASVSTKKLRLIDVIVERSSEAFAAPSSGVDTATVVDAGRAAGTVWAAAASGDDRGKTIGTHRCKRNRAADKSVRSMVGTLKREGDLNELRTRPRARTRIFAKRPALPSSSKQPREPRGSRARVCSRPPWGEALGPLEAHFEVGLGEAGDDHRFASVRCACAAQYLATSSTPAHHDCRKT